MELRRMTNLIIAAVLLSGCAVEPPSQPASLPDKAPVVADPAPAPAPGPAPTPGAKPTPTQPPVQVDQPAPTQTENTAQPAPSAPPPLSPTPPMTPGEAIRLRADAVLTALEQADPVLLADLVHPDKGVRFSPYAFVQTDRDLVFLPEDLRTADPARTYEWGAYDGSGAPIEMTLPEYLKSVFVYGADYRNAPQVGLDEALRTGNSVHNIPAAYPEGHFIEFHFPGTEEQDHVDWSSLRLVFEESGGTWYLVGVVHDQWTI